MTLTLPANYAGHPIPKPLQMMDGIWASKQNADGTLVRLPAAQLRYPSLMSVSRFKTNTGKDKHDVTLLFPPGVDFKAYGALAFEAAKSGCGTTVEKQLQHYARASLKDPCSDDPSVTKNPMPAEFKGWRSLRVSTTILDSFKVLTARNEEFTGTDAQLVSMWAVVTVRLYGYNNANTGVGASPVLVQLLMAGSPLPGAGSVDVTGLELDAASLQGLADQSEAAAMQSNLATADDQAADDLLGFDK